MKVNNHPSTNPQVIEKAKTSERLQDTGRTGDKSALDSAQTLVNDHGGASVQISDNAKLMQEATLLARNAPDVRHEKVSSLKKSIQDGTYHVDAAAIADRLVDSHLNSDFGKNNL